MPLQNVGLSKRGTGESWYAPLENGLNLAKCIPFQAWFGGSVGVQFWGVETSPIWSIWLISTMVINFRIQQNKNPRINREGTCTRERRHQSSWHCPGTRPGLGYIGASYCSTMGIKTYKLHQDTRFWTQKDICFASSLFAVCSSISMCRRVHNLLRRLWGVPLSDERDMSTAGFLLGRFLSCAAVHLQFEQCPIPGLSGLSRVGVIYPFTLQHLFLSIWNDTVWKHLHFRDQFARETMIFHIAVHLVSGYSCWRPHCEITILVEFLDSICSNCNKLGNSCQLNYIESSLVYPSGFVDPF